MNYTPEQIDAIIAEKVMGYKPVIVKGIIIAYVISKHKAIEVGYYHPSSDDAQALQALDKLCLPIDDYDPWDCNITKDPGCGWFIFIKNHETCIEVDISHESRPMAICLAIVDYWEAVKNASA